MSTVRTFETINGERVDVTTVFDKNVGTYVPTDELRERLDREARELLSKFFNGTFDKGEGLEEIFNTVFKNKAWLIKAFEKSPFYNGNLQIVLRDQDLARRINMEEISNFSNYVYNWVDQFYYNEYKGKRYTSSELEDIYEELRRQRGDAANEGDWDKYDEISGRMREIRNTFPTIDEKYRFVTEIVGKVTEELRGGVNSVTTESLSDFENIAKRYGIEKFRISEGLKLSRLIGKVGKFIGLDKHVDIKDASFTDQDGNLHTRMKDFGWNYKYAKFCDAINPLIIKGTAVISVNPIDFWTMSFGTNWASCHTIDKRNKRMMPRHYNGCYCGGTESYMLDSSSVIFYFLPEKFDSEFPENEAKVKRCMFYLGEDKLIQSRTYPDGRDGGDASVAYDIRGIMQKTVAELFNVPNLWQLKKGSYECSIVTNSEGPHYRDYEEYDDCNVSYLKRIDGYLNTNPVEIGSEIICPECGEWHYTNDNIFCNECVEGKVHCNSCGSRIYGDDIYWVDGDPYCCDCIDVCYHCDETYISTNDETEPHGGRWLERYNRCVCADCLADRYTWSEYEDDYVDNYNVVETEEGNAYHVESDGYMICDGCGEPHDADVMEEVDDGYFCPNCRNV